jgi:hypothetical protein
LLDATEFLHGPAPDEIASGQLKPVEGRGIELSAESFQSFALREAPLMGAAGALPAGEKPGFASCSAAP